MSPRTAKQNKQIREQKELQILSAALQMFSENGFGNTSMQSVSKAAGVSKGNLYNYFESKEALLERIIQNGLEKIMLHYTGIGSIENEAEFEKILKASFEMLRENQAFWKLFYNLVTQPKVQQLFHKIFYAFFESYMSLYVTYYQNKGEKNPEAVALLLGAGIDGISLAFSMMGDLYPLDDVVGELIEKFK
jgi:AcrR family transcriptional regulator